MTGTDTPRIIAGFGRSGTTWVLDVLAESNELRPIFEPLHPASIDGAERYAQRCFLKADRRTDLYDLLDPYIRGNYRSLWVDYRIYRKNLVPTLESVMSWGAFKSYAHFLLNSKSDYIKYRAQKSHRRRIIKFVRANMMLGWLQENFNARIAFLIRHPVAVVSSQMRAAKGWNISQRISVYRNDERLLSEINEATKTLLFTSLDDVKSYTLSWCIENHVALRQCRENGIHVCHYEKLLSSPEEEWSYLLTALDLSIYPSENLISRPSQQAWGKKAKDENLVRQYDSWLKAIEDEVKDKIQHVLDETGMDIYSVKSADPCCDVPRV